MGSLFTLESFEMPGFGSWRRLDCLVTHPNPSLCLITSHFLMWLNCKWNCLFPSFEQEREVLPWKGSFLILSGQARVPANFKAEPSHSTPSPSPSSPQPVWLGNDTQGK